MIPAWWRDVRRGRRPKEPAPLDMKPPIMKGPAMMPPDAVENAGYR
jgi:hypothetical protein